MAGLDVDRLKQQLAARGFELSDVAPQASASRGADAGLEVSAGCRHCFHPAGFGALEVLIPVSLHLQLDAQGTITSLSGGQPSADDVAAAGTWLDDLIANHQLADPSRPAPAATRQRRATHTIVQEADGRRVVRRIGFDAAAEP